jgi:hypothetical protein
MISVHSPKCVFAIIIIIIITMTITITTTTTTTTDCRIWIHIKTTQFKNLVCFSCKSPDDEVKNVETCNVHLRVINNTMVVQ